LGISGDSWGTRRRWWVNQYHKSTLKRRNEKNIGGSAEQVHLAHCKKGGGKYLLVGKKRGWSSSKKSIDWRLKSGATFSQTTAKRRGGVKNGMGAD